MVSFLDTLHRGGLYVMPFMLSKTVTKAPVSRNNPSKSEPLPVCFFTAGLCEQQAGQAVLYSIWHKQSKTLK